MPDGRDPITVKILSRIGEVPAAEWDACAGIDLPDSNPFVSHAFLDALESSRSVRPESGWQAQHLVVEDAAGHIAGAAPMYLKSHSMGEYVFDYGWANAYERAGGNYYPKLQVSVPFTPVTGPRLLVRPGAQAETTKAALIAGMMEWTRRHSLSSLHVTFATAEDAAYLEASDFLIRHNHQYHWFNRGYATFEDFLATLNSRKRKMIRRERRKVEEEGITMRCLTGGDLTPAVWDAFYRFYTDTYDRKWGYPYLTRRFFDIISETMPDKVLLVIAAMGDRPIAGALNLIGGDALYGRNWGCVADYKFLHFETCYYSAIDFAIQRGLGRVEAGTQGPHKMQRGYEPVQTRSAHYIREQGFRDAVARFLEQERYEEGLEMEDLEQVTPYRKDVSEP